MVHSIEVTAQLITKLACAGLLGRDHNLTTQKPHPAGSDAITRVMLDALCPRPGSARSMSGAGRVVPLSSSWLRFFAVDTYAPFLVELYAAEDGEAAARREFDLRRSPVYEYVASS